MKVKVDKVKIYVTARFHAEGSVLRETIRSGGIGVDMRSEITSGDPVERVAALIRNAEQGCYINADDHQSDAGHKAVHFQRRALRSR